MLARDVALPRASGILIHAGNGIHIDDIGASGIIDKASDALGYDDLDGQVLVNVAGYRGTASVWAVNRETVRGRAFINVLIESKAVGGQALGNIGNNFQGPMKNLHFIHCLAVGERTNWAYEDTYTLAGAGQIKKRFRALASLFSGWFNKDDTFQHVTARTHVWSEGHHCGHRHMTIINNPAYSGGGDGSAGRESWSGEVHPATVLHLGSAAGLFVNDQSGPTGAGGGNYQPPSGSNIPAIPGADLGCALDLFGNARRTDGTERQGPIARAA